jgi:hypothetical protein
MGDFSPDIYRKRTESGCQYWLSVLFSAAVKDSVSLKEKENRVHGELIPFD